MKDPTGVTLYTYDDLDRPVKLHRQNGLTTTYGYDLAGNLSLTENTKPNGDLACSYVYDYDAAGQVASVTEDYTDRTDYIYDAAGRLVEVYQEGGPNCEKYVDYTYDGDGNRVGLVAHVEEPGDNGLHLGWYKADEVKDEDVPGNGHGNGNGGGNANAGGNGNGSAGIPPGQAKKDAPDGSKGNGKGQAKGGKPDSRGRSGEAHGKGKAKGQDKSNKNKVYDLELSHINDILAPLPEVLATYDEQGQPRDTFVYGLQRLTGIGSDGKATVYVYDGLGSVRQLADAQGAVFDRYTYSPYGLPAANGRLNPSHKLNDGNTFGFGGQDHDPVFGMVYLRARYYAPGLDRFTAPDPLVTAGFELPGMSPYAYGRDNPLTYLDPSGLVAEKVQAGRSLWIGTVASIGLSFVPGLGDLKDMMEALTGVDLITGQRLTGLDRGIAIAAAFLPFVGGTALRKAISEIGHGTKEQLELIAEGVNKAIPGKGAVVGTKKHKLFQQGVEALKNPRLRTEVPMMGGELAAWGTKGSVRIDVFERDVSGAIKAVYDLKTGGAVLTPERTKQIQEAVGFAIDVIEVR